KRGLRRRPAAVPLRELFQRGGNQLGDGGVVDAAPEHGGDGRNETQQDEQQQRGDEGESQQALLAPNSAGLAGFGMGHGGQEDAPARCPVAGAKGRSAITSTTTR